MQVLFNYFSKFPLFEKLNMTDFDYNQKSNLFKSIRYKYYNEGAKIFNFGEFGDQFYIVLKGKVSVRIPKFLEMKMTRHEFFKYILINLEFINLNDPVNLSINEFSEISEALQDIKHKAVLDKITSEKPNVFTIQTYLNYYFDNSPSLKSYSSNKSKSTKIYNLKILAEVVSLSDGSSFGELALMNSKPRAATIVTLASTHVGYLVKTDYQSIIGKAMK